MNEQPDMTTARRIPPEQTPAPDAPELIADPQKDELSPRNDTTGDNLAFFDLAPIDADTDAGAPLAMPGFGPRGDFIRVYAIGRPGAPVHISMHGPGVVGYHRYGTLLTGFRLGSSLLEEHFDAVIPRRGEDMKTAVFNTWQALVINTVLPNIGAR